MKDIVILFMLCSVFTFFVYKKDKAKRLEYKKWKYENGFTDNDIGV